MSNFIDQVDADGLPIGNPRQSAPPQRGSGHQVDPVTANYVVDNGASERPRLRKNPRLKFGTVPQRNHKVIKPV